MKDIRETDGRQHSDGARRTPVHHDKAYFEQLFESAPEGIVIVGNDHRIQRINSTFTRIFGFTEEDAVGQPIDELIAPGDLLSEGVAITRSALAGESISIETIRRCKSGGTIDVNILATPIMSESGQLGTYAIYRDVSERKEFERRLKLLARFPDENPDPVLQVRADGTLLYANHTSEYLLEHWGCRQGGKVPAGLTTEVADVLHSGRRRDIDITCGNVSYTLRFSPVIDDGLVNIYGMDITERKRAEQENRVMARFFSENPDPSLRIDHQGTLLYANRPSLPLLDQWGCAIGGSVPESVELMVNRVLASGSRIDVELEAGERTFSLRFAPNREELYVNIYGLDITDAKQADEQRRRLREQLTRAERMESLGLLAGGVAHDLNNILGPLVAYPDLIAMKLPPDSPIRSSIGKIGSSARRAADLVQDLLTMARRGRYDMSPLDLNYLISGYLESPEFESVKNRYPMSQVSFDTDDDLPHVFGSEPHLAKVVMNLVINALEAMPQGGHVTLRTSCEELSALMSGFDNIHGGRYVILSVRDTGMGISEADRERLFEPFYSRKSMGRSGSGLGLAIVYGVVKDHNGYIDVRSEVDQGTEFIIYLPTVTQNLDIHHESEHSLDIRGSERILVVDDLAEQRELAATVLGSLGYRVEVAENGAEALAFLRGNLVDVVILDMMLGAGIDGLDVYRDIVSYNPSQKAIIASGYSETDRVKEALRLGAGAFVRKPYTMQKMGRAIREVLAS